MPRRPLPEPLAARIGARIREIRLERGMRQAELADAGGISAGYVSSVERGVVSITYATLVRIAEALGVDPILLLVSSEDPRHARIVDVLNEPTGAKRRKPKAKRKS
jgi:transcriptional regulator with XRE-family HTH domain